MVSSLSSRCTNIIGQEIRAVWSHWVELGLLLTTGGCVLISPVIWQAGERCGQSIVNRSEFGWELDSSPRSNHFMSKRASKHLIGLTEEQVQAMTAVRVGDYGPARGSSLQVTQFRRRSYSTEQAARCSCSTRVT